jgi:LPXTG-motif cell wall-anchored protein
MHWKKAITPILLVLGVFFVGYGIYAKQHISRAEVEFHKMAQSKNSIVKSVGNDMEKRIGHYQAKMRWSLVSGVVLLVVGGFLFSRDRKKK